MLTISLMGFLKFLQTAVFVVGYISNNNLFPEPLSSEEEKIYLVRMSEGDEEARNILIERNLRLVAHVCKKYASTNVDQEDLISIGTIGLIKGINSFKIEKGARLSTYLEDTIGKDKDDNTVTLKEVLENNERNIEDEVDLKFKIKRLYEKIREILKDREKTIIELRFGLNGDKPKTQKQIAKMMGISRSYVSRIETKAIGKLAKELKE